MNCYMGGELLLDIEAPATDLTLAKAVHIYEERKNNFLNEGIPGKCWSGWQGMFWENIYAL